MTLKTWDIWNSPSFPSIKRKIFITRELPPLSFLKVNFDDNMTNGRGEAGFVIQGLDSRLIAVGGIRFVETSVPRVELRATWKGIYFARLTLRADCMIVEGDSSTVVIWLHGHPNCDMATHLLVCDIHWLLLGYIVSGIRHIYHEANNVIDWVTSFIAQHSDRNF